MKRSTDRILTTHVGSLIRPAALRAFLSAKEAGGPFDRAAYAKCLKQSVAEVVRKQADIGIDVISDGERQQAIADAMHGEYKMIIDAGLLVQLDDARAAVSYDRMVPPKSLKEYRAWLARQVEIINHAIKGLPREKIRYHICWGSWPGPHSSDVPFKDIADLVLKVRAGGYSIELANPRHEHEWRLWEHLKLPKDAVLIPGVISHATNIVEHPELVAERIVRLARLVGRENVIASTDCGFAQVTYFARVHPPIMWAKLEALVDGARLASKELWGSGVKSGRGKSAPRTAA